MILTAQPLREELRGAATGTALLAAGVVLLLVTIHAGPAQAQTIALELCNEGTLTVKAAVVHGAPRATMFTSSGWYSVDPGRCSSVVPSARVLYLAFAAADAEGEGLIALNKKAPTDLTASVDLRFCVGLEPSYTLSGTLAELATCRNPQHRVIPFNVIVTANGTIEQLRYRIAPTADSRLIAIPDTARAYYEQASRYRGATGAATDLAAAAAYYEKAAGLGHLPSQIRLAGMYEEGIGVAKDEKLAMAWYLKAAERGDVVAQTAVGYMHAHGLGGPVNDAEAVQWYLKAAAQAYRVAQHNLGHMYESGRGVEKDLEAALLWYRAAAAGKNTHAAEDLQRLSAKAPGPPK